MQVNIIIILELHQKFFIVILKKVYPMLSLKYTNIIIKYCVWHYKISLEVQKNKLFIMKLKIIIIFICFIKLLKFYFYKS